MNKINVTEIPELKGMHEKQSSNWAQRSLETQKHYEVDKNASLYPEMLEKVY